MPTPGRSTYPNLVVQAPAVDEDFGFRSVFVRGPDKVLVELVEAAPLATE
jgi:hypothetical protein